MLERVALHQTRLRVPGIALDARGVVRGSRGLVMLPSIDRLAGFLAMYTAEHALQPLVDSLRIEVVRSKLGTSEIALSFESESSDRLDRVADVARLAGGFTFTGTSRHFVQYRDASAPFGYDATEITATDAELALYHSSFSQAYDVERKIDLSNLLLRLMPTPDHDAPWSDGPRWIVAEGGLGEGLTAYFVRSGVEARAGIAEWPPETSFDTRPVRRWLFTVPKLPERMRSLVRSTPGLASYLPVGPGVAVEEGWEHPVHLRACPVFDAGGLTLFRGSRQTPLIVDKLPALGDVRAIATVGVHSEIVKLSAVPAETVTVRVDLRLVPSVSGSSPVVASFVPRDELSLLRRLAYALGRHALEQSRIAVVDDGAFVISERGVADLPLGRFYRRIHSAIFVPLGFDLVPSVSADVLERSLGAPSGHVVFFRPDSSVVALDGAAFAPLQAALVGAQRWAPLDASDVTPELEQSTPSVLLEPLGLRPLSRAKRSP